MDGRLPSCLPCLFHGQAQDYYADFGEPTQLIRILEQPYLYHWQYSGFRDRTYGARADVLGNDRFVVFLQNHDQIGNRARGDRLTGLLGSEAKQRLAASILLLSPYLPLLFMGEEYGEQNPFPFFCSFRSTELAKMVCDGRREQFAGWGTAAEVPDPGSDATFASARLSWSWPEGSFAQGCAGCIKTCWQRGGHGRGCAVANIGKRVSQARLTAACGWI